MMSRFIKNVKKVFVSFLSVVVVSVGLPAPITIIHAGERDGVVDSLRSNPVSPEFTMPDVSSNDSVPSGSSLPDVSSNDNVSSGNSGSNNTSQGGNQSSSQIDANEIHISVLNSDYSSYSQNLVNVTVDFWDATVEYSTDGTNWTGSIPSETNADEYDVYVKVTRPGFDPFISEKYTAVIHPIDITGIDINPLELNYIAGTEQQLVEMIGSFRQGDEIHWFINGVDTDSETIPTAEEVGNYSVKLVIDRGNNYNEFTKTISTVISLPQIELGGLNVTGASITYDGNEHNAVSVSGVGSYTLMYQLDDGDELIDQAAWQTEIPTVIDAGSYIVWVKAIRENYEDKEVDVTPASQAIYPYNVYVSKASQNFSFAYYSGVGSDVELTASEMEAGYTFDFSANDSERKANGTITYDLDSNTKEVGIAAIDETTGLLTVFGAGEITIIATLSGNDNYDSCAIEYTLTVIGKTQSQGDWVSFGTGLVNYTLGDFSGIPENVARAKNIFDFGRIRYSIVGGSGLGLSIDDGGHISITDYSKLIHEIEENNGTIDVTVNATKERFVFHFFRFANYPQDTTSYTLRIDTASAPVDPCSIYAVSDTTAKLSGPNGMNGWFNTALSVIPAEGYQIIRANDLKGGNPVFSDYINIGESSENAVYDQGENINDVVYLRDCTTGYITESVTLGVNKVDTINPGNLEIIFPESDVYESVNYYGEEVAVVLNATDNTSGVDHFEWKYIREDGASLSNLELDEGVVDASVYPCGNDDNRYTGTLVLPREQVDQLRGNLQIVAVDAAGNRSVAYTDDGVFVIDTLPPTCSVEYRLKDGKGTINTINNFIYCSNSVEFTFKVVESNFYSDDIVVTVSRDGVTNRVRNLNWERTGNVDEYKAVLLLSADGEYVISLEYTDRSGKEMTSYTSGNFIVDTIKPEISVVDFSSPSNSYGGSDYYNGNLTARFSIKEKNFFAEDVEVKLRDKNGNLKEVNVSWSAGSSDVYTGTVVLGALSDHSNDGEYVFVVTYTDRSGNAMEDYISDKKIIDTIKPVIHISYDTANPLNTFTDSENHQRRYYGSVLTATVTIDEVNFSSEGAKYLIVTKDVSGNIISGPLYSVSSWGSSGNSNTLTIRYPGDANYTFSIECMDIAKNVADQFPEEYFTVDTTKPTDLKVEYSTPVFDTILSGVSFGYYNSKPTITISAYDNISGVNGLTYSCILSDGVSSINSGISEVKLDSSQIIRSENGAVGSAQFVIPADALGAGNQFDGFVSFYATDRSGNSCDSFTDAKRIVVDNISPTVDVVYSAPAQIINNTSYYKDNVFTTITIHEANFSSNDVDLKVYRNGVEYNVSTTWTDNSPDVHVGTFSLTEDGDYTVSVNYVDKSLNTMSEYKSGMLTVDTTISPASIIINEEDPDGKAYKDEITLMVSFADTNLDEYEIKLYKSGLTEKNIDVTDLFFSQSISESDDLVVFESATFDRLPENDGVYRLNTFIKDKAGNVSERNVIFTVNRFGSVYEYGDYLLSLISEGGAYVQDVGDDLVIYEFNADEIIEDSIDIIISRDGKPVENIVCEVVPGGEVNRTNGSNDWYQYTYIIDRTNFDVDGIYKISISSEDATGNKPENSNYKDKSILFRVDGTAPEITSVSGLESRIVNATDQEIRYTVYDTIGLKSIDIYIDGEVACCITDFSEDSNNYSGKFDLQENANLRKIRIVVTDKAGNVTDTGSESFSSSYLFNSEIIVSTNIFVRWYANKILFFGSIGCVMAVISAIGVVRRRKRKVRSSMSRNR